MSAPPIVMSAPHGPPGAPLLVLGNSLGTDSRLWSAAAPLLARRFRVQTWDLPGHGLSPATRDCVAVGDLADAVAASTAGPFLYAGVSLGGAVGLELARRHPARVRAVALVCAAARFGTPEAWSERAGQARTSGTASLVTGSATRWFAAGTIARRPVLSSGVLHALRDADDESYARCCEALARFDARPWLGEIHVPVLALWGAHDPVCGEADAECIAAGVGDGRARVIPGSSHLAPIDEPEATADALESYFHHEIGGPLNGR